MPTPTTDTYGFTGSTVTWTVPYHTSGTLRVRCDGGWGGYQDDAAGATGYAGVMGSIRGYVDLPPGTVITIAVGNSGGDGSGGSPGNGGLCPAAGFDGGAGGAGSRAGGGGGAASVVLVAGAPIIVAGGGGGGTSGAFGTGRNGATGGTGMDDGDGGDGTVGSSSFNGGNGGGGTLTGVGPGGLGPASDPTVPPAGLPGSTTTGGAGGDGSQYGGGGGGAGYFGAGGGGGSFNRSGAGGGGSSWADTSIVSSIDGFGGTSGNQFPGSIVVTYDWIADWVPPSSGWSVGFIKF